MSLTDAIAFTVTVLLFFVCVLFIEALFNVFAGYLTKDGRKPKFKRMDRPWKSIGTVTKMSETEKGLGVTLHDAAVINEVLWDERPLLITYKSSFYNGVTWHDAAEHIYDPGYRPAKTLSTGNKTQGEHKE